MAVSYFVWPWLVCRGSNAVTARPDKEMAVEVVEVQDDEDLGWVGTMQDVTLQSLEPS